jgi:hypothetical protein
MNIAIRGLFVNHRDGNTLMLMRFRDLMDQDAHSVNHS